MKQIRLSTALFAAGLVLPVVGCNSNSIFDGGPHGELEANQNRWREAGLSNYAYTFRRICFCPNTNLVRITVVDGVITGVTDVDSGDALDAGDFRFYETVAGLFEIVSTALEQADSLAVTYDAELGYPTQITIDYIENAIDDELSVTASDVLPLLIGAR